MNCKKCGMLLNPNEQYCRNCGEKVSVENSSGNFKQDSTQPINYAYNDVNYMNNNNNMNYSINNTNNSGNDASSINNFNTHYNSVNNINYTNNRKKKLIPIVIVVLVVLIGIGAFIYFTNDKKGLTDKEINDFVNQFEQEMNKHNEKLNKNYQVKSYILENDEILVEVKNNNDEIVMAFGTIYFYDNNKKIVDSDDIFFLTYIDENSIGYGRVNAVDRVVDYDSYEVKIELSTTYDLVERQIINNISFAEDVEDECLIFEVQNNTSTTIDDLLVEVVYYDSNNNVIGYERCFVYDVGINEVVRDEIDFPSDSENDSISYSRYEYLVSAYVEKD